jgi:DNA-binding NtrC family response regulator
MKRRQSSTAEDPNAEPATELDATGLDTEQGELGLDQVYLILQNAGQRRTVELADGQELVSGRGEECDLPLENQTKVSRKHFTVRRDGMFLTLHDLDSTNGTKLNGVTVRGGERRLVGGDVIQAGTATLTVAAASGTGIATTGVTSRLELELQRIDASDGSAALVRIDLPGGASRESMDQLTRLLSRVAVFEEREEGQYAALVEGTDPKAFSENISKMCSGAEITVVRFPSDGKSFAALWNATRASQEDIPELPKGVCIADPAMMKVYRVAQRVARTDTTVLILGETGVGKEVIAEQVHKFSARADKHYVRLNCASLPETLLSSELFGHERGAFTGADRRKVGYFEAADGGTLLLDEIGELSLSMQVKLLRVLENRTVLRLGATSELPVDVRVICSTHRDLQQDVADGRFREDLYYRVSAFTLTVPPLRDRPTEIGLLADVFMRQHAERMGTTPPTLGDAALAALTSHRWPGNVRELRNAIEHAFVMCDGDTILPEHLPESTRSPDDEPAGRASGGGVKDKLAQIERASIVKALADENGNQTRAAKRLGMSRRALIYKMSKYEIKRQPR